jgi:hypothetical protein
LYFHLQVMLALIIDQFAFSPLTGKYATTHSPCNMSLDTPATPFVADANLSACCMRMRGPTLPSGLTGER